VWPLTSSKDFAITSSGMFAARSMAVMFSADISHFSIAWLNSVFFLLTAVHEGQKNMKKGGRASISNVLCRLLAFFDILVKICFFLLTTIAGQKKHEQTVKG
jgi:hypothetical protein